MKVSELIRKLQELPDQEAEVFHLWDGELRTRIDHVYIGKTGLCVTAAENEVAYSNRGRPEDALDTEVDRYWYTPDLRLSEHHD